MSSEVYTCWVSADSQRQSLLRPGFEGVGFPEGLEAEC